MNHCSRCFYAKRTTVTDRHEYVLTCLHPLSRTPIGLAMACHQAREATSFCGPTGSAFQHANGSPQPIEMFRQ